MDYPTYVAISQYIVRRSYPLESNEAVKRRIRRLASKYFLLGGRLFANKKGDSGHELELLHEGNVKDIILQVHNEGHFGSKNTYERMRVRYVAPGLLEKVETVVRECDVCQFRARRPRRRVEVARPIKPPREPFTMIGCDAVGPVLESKSGNRYILVAIDYLTRWPMALAVPNINEVTTADFLYNVVVSNYGVPNYILTDRGSNFTSGYVQNFLQQLGCRHITTTAYRPQTNGLCERMNQTLVQTLAKIINERGTEDRWDEYVNSALLAIRTMKNISTGYTAGKLLFGYEMRTPGTWPVPREDFVEGNLVDEVADRVTTISKLAEVYRSEARKKVVEKQQERARRYNLSVAPRLRYKIGEQVLMKDQNPQTKFANRWLGPMVVVRTNENGTYWLEGPSKRRLDGAVNGDCLVPYHAKKHMVPDVQVKKVNEWFEAWVNRSG
ncbi:hypothetical protein [Absidia glauca]|uniref:Integrase catalytic domain-containing protein n=1 Tax=Absidia glauca TaxID=4829 RepID=A0A168NKD1_ABSGL|nr:hypothetical protein [Absidia glauca]